MKETITILEGLRDQLRSKKEQANKQAIDPEFKDINDQLIGVALAYGDAVLLVGEAIVEVLNNEAKKLSV
jgi:hypothetical protein